MQISPVVKLEVPEVITLIRSLMCNSCVIEPNIVHRTREWEANANLPRTAIGETRNGYTIPHALFSHSQVRPTLSLPECNLQQTLSYSA